jgi:hypothetical protein
MDFSRECVRKSIDNLLGVIVQTQLDLPQVCVVDWCRQNGSYGSYFLVNRIRVLFLGLIVPVPYWNPALRFIVPEVPCRNPT